MSRFHTLVSRLLPVEVWRAPLEPVLHPSPGRVRMVGLCLAAGQPLFYLIWTYLHPQPHEDLLSRLLLFALALVLLIGPVARAPRSTGTRRIMMAVCWVELPFFFQWMYLQNGGNAVWLASVCVMILVYHQLTDWRIATIGLATGYGAAWLLAGLSSAPPPPMEPSSDSINAILIAASWACALLLNLSAASLRRRRQLCHTLSTAGIMAHELRTPLATTAMIADALLVEARRMGPGDTGQRVEQMATRLHVLVRHMNHQIDTQIANAKLLNLPGPSDVVHAGTLARQALADYPFRGNREHDCVDLVVQEDFDFHGSSRQFTHVLHNLVNNALRSLATAGSSWHRGALRITVDVANGRGRIVVRDEGVGIDVQHHARLFDPFYSTDREVGHGLGLTLCREVVQGAGGQIRVRSAPAMGATFTIELPLAKPSPPLKPRST